MPSTVEKLSSTRAKLTVEIPFSELKPALDKAYQQIAAQVTIPGFRKGKVPPAVIDQRYGRSAVLQEAINEQVPTAYGEAVAEHGLVPLAQPEIDLTELEDGEKVVFVAEVDVRPEITLPDLTTVKATAENLDVSDSGVQERLDLLQRRFATTTEVDRPAANGDQVVIDLSAAQDGVTLEEATATGLTYVVGSGGMVDGLDDALVGLSAGEEATFSSTLIGGPRRGEPSDVTVKVTTVQEQELPELNDEFAQLASPYDSLDEMRADLADGALRQARLSQAADARDKVLEALIADTDFDVPEHIVANEAENRRDQINSQLASSGMTLEDYLAESESEPANTAEEFWQNVNDSAEKSLRAQLLLDTIADQQDVGVDQQDLTSMIMRKAQERGVSPEDEVAHMQEHNHLPEWMGEIRRSKALDYLIRQATITDESGNEIDLSRLQSDGSLAEEPAEESADEPAETQKPAPKAKKATKRVSVQNPADDADADEK